ncbi:MAG: hypothetical protein AB7F59_10845 [Bdellovibrionales bacterium]
MKLLIVIALVFSSSWAWSADQSALILRDAAQDQAIKEKLAKKDQELIQKRQALARVLGGSSVTQNDNTCMEKCMDLCNGQGTGGSAACWNKCVQEGYSSATCAGRCGVSTGPGSRACWNKCTQEGYSSATCAERCRVDSSEGSEACWNKCLNEGYNSATCAPRCGTSTPGGSQACWNKCTNEGYNSDTCSRRCGTN